MKTYEQDKQINLFLRARTCGRTLNKNSRSFVPSLNMFYRLTSTSTLPVALMIILSTLVAPSFQQTLACCDVLVLAPGGTTVQVFFISCSLAGRLITMEIVVLIASGEELNVDFQVRSPLPAPPLIPWVWLSFFLKTAIFFWRFGWITDHESWQQMLRLEFLVVEIPVKTIYILSPICCFTIQGGGKSEKWTCWFFG